MLLSPSALIACGPRPGACGKKHDLFSTAASASGQWRTRRGGRAPGGQQRAAEEPRPQAACACRRRKETKAIARRTQSRRPARAPGPGRTRGRRPGRAQAAPCTCRLSRSQWTREAADARESPRGTGLPGLGARSRPGPESSAAADHRTSEPARSAFHR